jgi:hypothetical protein
MRMDNVDALGIKDVLKDADVAIASEWADRLPANETIRLRKSCSSTSGPWLPATMALAPACNNVGNVDGRAGANLLSKRRKICRPLRLPGRRASRQNVQSLRRPAARPVRQVVIQRIYARF